MRTRWRPVLRSSIEALFISSRHSSSVARSYGDAIADLNSLQSNFQTVETLRKSGKYLNQQSIPEMVEYARRIGYEPSEFDRLRPIHIAGTKGKGSTSAFVSSILAQVSQLPNNDLPLKKIGLYTSPHLRSVRERIKINNEPITETLFTERFYDVWDRLGASKSMATQFNDLAIRPGYFRFLTLLAFHTYMSEGVDTAIFECGIGGEYDTTNIIQRPTVTGITTLGIDHTNILGDTIERIAWHKAGIMKKGVPCWSSAQAPTATEMLKIRAQEKGVSLAFRPALPYLRNITLGLPGEFQKGNASLAVAIACTHVRQIDPQDAERDSLTGLEEAVKLGLEKVKFPGRCDVRKDREASLTWHLDCAHTAESLKLASEWFVTATPTSNNPRILVFNQATRSPAPLLQEVFEATAQRSFTHVIFCTNRTYKDEGTVSELKNNLTHTRDQDSLELQNEMRDLWTQMHEARGQSAGSARVMIRVLSSIEEAIEACRTVASEAGVKNVDAFVTGSVHLVGGFLEVIETENEKEEGVSPQ